MSKFEASMKQFCTKYGESKILTITGKMTEMLSRIAPFFRGRLRVKNINIELKKISNTVLSSIFFLNRRTQAYAFLGVGSRDSQLIGVGGFAQAATAVLDTVQYRDGQRNEDEKRDED